MVNHLGLCWWLGRRLNNVCALGWEFAIWSLAIVGTCNVGFCIVGLCSCMEGCDVLAGGAGFGTQLWSQCHRETPSVLFFISLVALLSIPKRLMRRETTLLGGVGPHRVRVLSRGQPALQVRVLRRTQSREIGRESCTPKRQSKAREGPHQFVDFHGSESSPRRN